LLRQTVLVVEDDPAIARLVSLSLSDRFRVVTAGNGAEGLARLTHSQPDAVVIDLEMPVMNGWTFLPLLRWCLPAVPVVIVSGFDAVGAARLLHADGAFDKPFDPLTLADCIERLLDGMGPARA
jgi:CheY-like chemotaxis protein